MSVRIGFLINPIAGMGGPVGLKGTDGSAALEAARRLGAKKSAPERARCAMRALSLKGLDIDILTCSGAMGEHVASQEGFAADVVHRVSAETTAEDTVAGARAIIDAGARLIVFCGGDGTARDILTVADKRIPLVGIPAGVKMHSSVFAHTPEEAADLIESFARSGNVREAEVMDVDEESFRMGAVSSKLFGLALVPDDVRHMQSAKAVYATKTAADEAEEIAAFISDTMESGVLYIIGPGSTTKAIADALGEEKTGLGVDAYIDRKSLATDLSEKGILELLGRHDRARILVTPIGSQGFIFGRGNQQLSPEVLEAVGKENIVVVATPTKLRDTPFLRVDTGDSRLDEALRGTVKVVTGYKRRTLMKVL